MKFCQLQFPVLNFQLVNLMRFLAYIKISAHPILDPHVPITCVDEVNFKKVYIRFIFFDLLLAQPLWGLLFSCRIFWRR